MFLVVNSVRIKVIIDSFGSKKLALIVFICISLSTLYSDADAKVFHLNQIPAGRSVTLPQPVETVVELGNRIRLNATDLPQSVKISLQSLSPTTQPVRLGIFDGRSVRYISIDTQPLLYSFKNLQEVVIMTGIDRKRPGSLTIESNRPLTVGR